MLNTLKNYKFLSNKSFVYYIQEIYLYSVECIIIIIILLLSNIQTTHLKNLKK